MKRLILLLILLSACSVSEKVFVANEESGSVSVIDAVSLKEIDRISLTMEHEGARVEFAPHNVQVVGNAVLVTANVAHKNHGESEEVSENHGDHEMASVPVSYFEILAVSAHGEEETESSDHADQLVVVDAKSHKIMNRFDLDFEAHLAHVVSDGVFAYVTSTDKDLLYKVDLSSGKISFIVLPNGSMPHGVRLSEDNSKAVVAGMSGDLLIVDLSSKEIESVKLPGKGVQAGIVNDLVIVSVFDTKQLALYDLSMKELSLVDLPDAVGPIQMYWTADKKFVYVADQGVYFGEPEGGNTYKVDLENKKVVAVIDTGYAPHGVVVSPDNRVWVSNLNGNSVSLIVNDVKVAEIPVGAAPNGISYWSQ